VTTVAVFRAQETVSDEPVPTLELVAYEAAPNFPTLVEAGEAYERDAKTIADALFSSLPGGTIDRLLVEMLSRKASHFRVPYGMLEGYAKASGLTENAIRDLRSGFDPNSAEAVCCNIALRLLDDGAPVRAAQAWCARALVTSKERDRLAAGANPRERVAVPQPGQRCPRHHGVVTATSPLAAPCLLCRPDLVPVAFGGTLEPKP
jgi:hypothetical protein